MGNKQTNYCKQLGIATDKPIGSTEFDAIWNNYVVKEAIKSGTISSSSSSSSSNTTTTTTTNNNNNNSSSSSSSSPSADDDAAGEKLHISYATARKFLRHFANALGLKDTDAKGRAARAALFDLLDDVPSHMDGSIEKRTFRTLFLSLANELRQPLSSSLQAKLEKSKESLLVRTHSVALGASGTLRCDVQVRHGDITEERSDAIVNAANDRLMHGSGVAGAIARKGGHAIRVESQAYIERHGSLPTGRACATSSGELPCRLVVHTVGPICHDSERMAEYDAQLASAVYQALQVGLEHGATSISLPAISSGIFGYPKPRCARVLFDTALRWLNDRVVDAEKQQSAANANAGDKEQEKEKEKEKEKEEKEKEKERDAKTSSPRGTAPALITEIRFCNFDQETVDIFAAEFDQRYGAAKKADADAAADALADEVAKKL